jgi:hypothetical protein
MGFAKGSTHPCYDLVPVGLFDCLTGKSLNFPIQSYLQKYFPSPLTQIIWIFAFAVAPACRCAHAGYLLRPCSSALRKNSSEALASSLTVQISCANKEMGS